jgi:hypothetical protein
VLAQTQEQAIPSTFFGVHVNNPQITQNETSYPLQVGYGEFRNWDVWHDSWPDIEQCEAASGSPSDPCFGPNGNLANFTQLQYALQHLKSVGVDNVTFTLSRTPKWADQNTNQQTDPNCNYFDANDPNNTYGGACYAPTGPTTDQNYPHLHTDGTGDDLIWRNWVTAIATYVNNYQQTWCGTTCAHVKYWEIWNEFDRNNTNYSLLDPNSPNTKVSWYASTDPTYGCQVLGFAPCPTPDQLVRMTEDARCIINGTGYVDNYPAKGAHTPYNQLGSGWIVGIDATAEIVQPSVTSPKATNALQCYLYCNSAACGAWYKSRCVNPNLWAHSSQSVDVIDFHDYFLQSNPEDHSASGLRGALQSNEQGKPMWIGEGSWGNIYQGGQLWQDPYVKGGLVPRYFAIEWQNTIPQCAPGSNCTPCSWNAPTTVCQQVFWYGYDYDTNVPSGNYSKAETGAIYCPGQTAHGSCNDGSGSGGTGLIEPTASMWNVAVGGPNGASGWLTNAQPDSTGTNPFCNAVSPNNPDASVWYCDFTVSGTQYRMVWDTTNSAAAQKQTNYCAANFVNPYVCGTTPYSPAAQYQHWVDLSGTKRDVYTVPFVVGLNPVLLEP